MTEFEGQIWAAQHNDDIKFICTAKRVKKKIQAINDKGRDLRLSQDKLLWQYPSQAQNIEDWKEKIIQIQATVDALSKDIDVDLLWEGALELEISEITDFADLYFTGDITTEHLVAIWCVLADNRFYFKRRNQNWEPRSPEQVQELKTQRDREFARIKAQNLASDWLLEMAKIQLPLFPNESFKIVELQKDIIPFVERLEAWLRGDADKEAEDLIIRTAETVKLSARELVFEILQKIGRLALDADRDIILGGLKPEFSASINKIVQAIPPVEVTSTQKITDLLFSIDDEDTREVDDALTIEREDLLWKITIAIADPASMIHRGDILDKEAMRRGTTVYLPTQTVFMLPEHISCDIASLSAEHVRSSIVIRVWLDDQAEISKSSISRELIKVQQRLHYDETDTLIAQGENDTAEHLRSLLNCAKQLHQQRIANHALVLQRLEYKITVNKDKIDVSMINQESPSRLLVAEMMILANHVAAKYAYMHEIPLIYRIQPPPMERITPEMTADPLSFHKVRKFISRSSLSLQPAGHSGLGLSMYTQFSSPLRRFADLVMQRQLMAHLLGEDLPYDVEELFQVLETAERTARDARSLEREAKKRWLMLYFKQTWGKNPLDVRVINEVKGGYKVETQWGIEAYLAASRAFDFGETVTAFFDKIRIKAGTIRLKLG